MSTELSLHALRVDDADEMVVVLAAPELYAITGGGPPSLEELRRRYESQVAGSGRADEQWLNWIVRLDGAAVGYVQATVVADTATLAWLIGVPWQRQGHATTATAAMMELLRSDGVTRFEAWIAPGHVGSETVARQVGLAPTDETDDDGEVRWSS